MHLKKEIDITEFLKQVMHCQSEVYFETPDGDSLALKSALSQYIFCSITNEDGILQTGTIRTEDPRDMELLISYCK